MDPNETLRHMLELAKRIQRRDEALAAAADGNRPLGMQVALLDEQAVDASTLAELALVLDAWLHNGGFLPRQWERKA